MDSVSDLPAESQAAIRRIRIASWLICAKCVMTPVSLAFLAYSLVLGDRGLTSIALGCPLLTGLFVVLQWLVSQRTSCPLCMTPVLAAKRCTKHRNARSFLGSHRLRTALAVIFTNSFRCPYCNEPALLEVRTRRHR